MDLLIAIALLVICYFTGRTREKRHYKSIREREVKLYKQPHINFSKNVNISQPVKNAQLVSASVVIGCDYFKVFLASLRNIFGGNVSAYESVLDRGRREAILRIRESAYRMRADLVMNIKIETVMLSEQTMSQVCITAYGTAVEYDKNNYDYEAAKLLIDDETNVTETNPLKDLFLNLYSISINTGFSLFIYIHCFRNCHQITIY